MKRRKCEWEYGELGGREMGAYLIDCMLDEL